jgi:type I restriction enzyme S subunit
MSAEPASWDTVPLRSLCLETTTVDPTRNPDKAFEYVDVSAVSNELWKVISRTTHTGATAPSRARKLVRTEDVIFATVRPTLKRVALVPQDLDGQVVSTAFCVLRANRTKADPRFIYYSILTEDFMNRVRNLERGASYPAVTDNDVLEQELVVPPLTEQRAIAAALSKIQAAVEVQEKMIATLKELKAATMAKLFREGLRSELLKQTEIGEIPESWEVVRLGKIARIGNGSTPKRDKPNYWENGNIPWLTSAKIHESVIESADEFVTEIARAECHLPLVRKHSIVVAITGQGKTLGNAALVTFDTCVSQHLAYIQFESDEALPEFMLFFLQGRYRDLRQVSQSGGSTRGALTCGFLKNYCVPIPSIEEQRQIARMLGLLSIRVKREEARRQTLKSLFTSMLHLLMTGQVRVNHLMIEATLAGASLHKDSCQLSESVLSQQSTDG